MSDFQKGQALSPDLERKLLEALPPSFYYISDFVTAEEEKSIWSAIQAHPPARWTNLSHRRLLSLPSPLTGVKRDTLLSTPLPAFLAEPVVARLVALGLFADSPHQAPNHCLVNEYAAGEGIMPHEDGPAYHPITATVSLGSHTVLNIYNKNADGEREQSPRWRILQEPRSLLVTKGEAYAGTLHSIAEVEVDEELNSAEIANWRLLGNQDMFDQDDGKRKRGTRVSLTYRDVKKISKIGNALGFMKKM